MLNYIFNEYIFATVVLYGQSIGSGPTMHLAAKHPNLIEGVILQSPFTSIRGVIRSHVWPLGYLLSFFVEERFDNLKAMANINPKLPMRIIHGLDDTLIPYEHTVQLAHVLSLLDQPFRRVLLRGDHNSLDPERLMAEQLNFFNSLKAT